MARKDTARKEKDYDDIPGTVVFDAERSRQGFGINMFCMSLMKDENRKAFKANEPEYLKKFNLTPAQTEAVLKRDYNRMLELGGNIYFTAKLGATDGHSFRHLAAVMTGTVVVGDIHARNLRKHLVDVARLGLLEHGRVDDCGRTRETFEIAWNDTGRIDRRLGRLLGARGRADGGVVVAVDRLAQEVDDGQDTHAAIGERVLASVDSECGRQIALTEQIHER